MPHTVSTSLSVTACLLTQRARACCPVIRHRPPVMIRSDRETRPDSRRLISPSAKATAAWVSSCRRKRLIARTANGLFEWLA